ncbi:MAG: DUF2953 domain-containing protein [Bacillota bacterium]|jgi:hypothetical protein|nr:DUF2953 domain-containing protein [Bacillota bacterium]HHT91493.1 DUF2953 domain-containing protein [Bacillota bacterium]
MLLGLFFLFMLGLLLIVFSVEFRLVTKGLVITPQIKFGVGPFRVAFPQRLLAKMSQRIRRRSFANTEAVWRGTKMAWRLSNSFLQKIDLLHLEVLIGLGDPFWTALGVGSVWTVLGPILTGLRAGNRLDKAVDVQVLPDYGDPSVQVDLHCIFRFRLGQIIVNELLRARPDFLAKERSYE